MSMPALFKGRLSIPVIGSPLFIISVPDLVIAQCKAGVVGSFPALNARPAALLDEWLARITEELAAYDRTHPERPSAPFAVNQIVHRSNNRLEQDLALCEKYKVPMMITSLGAREELNKAAHGWGGIVFHDVINQTFAHKAIEKGADGSILVAAGAGGHAGTISPFAFVAETRSWFDGPIALSGAIANGRAIRAARVLGADFAYIGSAFIATKEANAVEGYKQMITSSGADDIVYSRSVHRGARQLPEAVDRRRRPRSGQPPDLRSVEDELRHRCLGRARQAEGMEGDLGDRGRASAPSRTCCPPPS
ncbi:NAD(P)H-dependent flavin oxidoreductase [Bradyrhizobium oligotrophicum S58]